MPIVTPTEVATELGRDLTSAEQARVQRRVQAWTSILEGKLHRGLQVEQRVETIEPLPEGTVSPSVGNGWSTIGSAGAVVHLPYPPIATVTSVIDTITGSNITAYCKLLGAKLYVSTFNPVTITYIAGDDPTAPEVKEVMLDALMRKLFVGPQAAAGVDVSYSVEGQSFQFGQPNPGDGGVGPFTGQEIRSLQLSLGRLQIR